MRESLNFIMSSTFSKFVIHQLYHDNTKKLNIPVDPEGKTITDFQDLDAREFLIIKFLCTGVI